MYELFFFCRLMSFCCFYSLLSIIMSYILFMLMALFLIFGFGVFSSGFFFLSALGIILCECVCVTVCNKRVIFSRLRVSSFICNDGTTAVFQLMTSCNWNIWHISYFGREIADFISIILVVLVLPCTVYNKR